MSLTNPKNPETHDQRQIRIIAESRLELLHQLAAVLKKYGGTITVGDFDYVPNPTIHSWKDHRGLHLSLRPHPECTNEPHDPKS